MVTYHAHDSVFHSDSILDIALLKLLQGFLFPNDKATINFTAHLDTDSAFKFNLVSKQIEYTLVLHTALGQDYFVTATGEYRE